MKIKVVNLRGIEEPFSFKKVYRSARNAGATREIAFEIARQIEKEAFDGISTAQIFKRVFELLAEKSPQAAIKFNLKKAMTKLGPTGFPFEKFVARIFEVKGFVVSTNQIVAGCCINYEIDFLAKKGNLIYIGECKFRQDPGGRVELKDALANYARFLDIQKGMFFDSKVKCRSILVTNAKFTNDAIKYSECVGVELLGWKHPKSKGLETVIEENKLYPITILPSVSSKIAKELIFQGVVLVKDIFKKTFEGVKIPKKRKVLKEGEILLGK